MGECNSCVIKDPSMDMAELDPKSSEYQLLTKIIRIQKHIRAKLGRKKGLELQFKKYKMKVRTSLNEFYLKEVAKYQTEEPFDFLECLGKPWGGQSSLDTRQQEKKLEFRSPKLLPQKELYIGEWGQDQRVGWGLQIWEDGKVYEGEWLHDKMHGHGRLIYPSQDVYQGGFQDGLRQGKGTLKHKDGSTVQALWQRDQQQGRGEEVWQDGSSYSGFYVNGKKHGKGRFLLKCGTCYEGDFKNDKFEGHGDYQWADQRRYVGQWVTDQMHGLGVFSWGDGRFYLGDYHKDRRAGFGVQLFGDGRLYYGTFEKGKQHGQGVLISANHVKKLGQWEMGNRTRWVIFETEQTLAQLDQQYNDYTKQLQHNPLFLKAKLPCDVSTLTSSEGAVKFDMEASQRQEDIYHSAPNVGLFSSNLAKGKKGLSALEQSQMNLRLMQSTYKDMPPPS